MKKNYRNILAGILAVSLISAHAYADTALDADTITLTVSDSAPSQQQPAVNSQIATDNTSNAAKTQTKISGTITAGALNVRSAPWGDVIGTLNHGENVEIIDIVGDWYKINFEGKTGYIYGSWVTTPDKQGQTSPKYGYVSNCLWANVHRTPSGDVISKYQSGEQVYILGEAGEWYKIKYNDNEAFVAKNYIDLNPPEVDPSSITSENFTGYVTASALNVRTGVWGDIVGLLYNGASVKVTGKCGDWYTIDYNGTTRFVSAKYISKSQSSGSSTSSSSNFASISNSSSNYSSVGNATSAANGTLQQKIVSSARALVGSTKFRTSDVSGGRLACAKVATTALVNAGALDKVVLNCRSAIKALKEKGWKEVSVPPYQEGDVITWKTYDYTGDGKKDDDSHIGIIVKEGNTFKAMNNSSSLRTPRITSVNIAPVSRVLRKV